MTLMRRSALMAALSLSGAGCGGGGGGQPAGPDAAAGDPLPTVQESQCHAAGWQREVVDAAGLRRLVLWKAPAGPWSGGAIVVMHGGGGSHTNFCVANVALIEPQVRFTTLALARGWAVFLLDSSDRVSDDSGRLCGKVWDDESRPRANLDLPFIDRVLHELIPSRRPAGSRADLYLTGLSSGGYMSTRAATRFGASISAFAPVSAGDPYGWTRDCTPRAGDRPNVFGIAFDLETRRQIVEPDACAGTLFPNERAWDGAEVSPKPAWRVLHHVHDGIHDRSCVQKLRLQLSARGYPEAPPLTLEGGSRSADLHYWLDEYNVPLLDFFASRRR